MKRLSILSLLLLGACQPVDQPAAGFGDAVRNNMAVQLVNPTPAAAAELPENNGARAGLAMQRYQEFKVFAPVSPKDAGAVQK